MLLDWPEKNGLGNMEATMRQETASMDCIMWIKRMNSAREILYSRHMNPAIQSIHFRLITKTAPTNGTIIMSESLLPLLLFASLIALESPVVYSVIINWGSGIMPERWIR